MRKNISSFKLRMLFNQIKNGEIVVPDFQRPYVWGQKDILNLIDSVYKGYPIGMILLLDSETNALKIASSSKTGFPEVPIKSSVKYVIDGMQRLSTLYNCFHWKHPRIPNKFNLVFDINEKRFLHYKKNVEPSSYIHLSAIFKSETFFDLRNSYIHSNDLEKLSKSYAELHYIFESYEVAVMVFFGNVEEAPSIFESVNTTGHRLSKKDILKAESLRKRTRISKFEIIQDTRGQYRFHLKASNGQILLSSENYKYKEEAKEGIKLVRKYALENNHYERRSTSTGRPYFVLRTAYGDIIGRSETYSSYYAVEDGIEKVKQNIIKSKVVDLTDVGEV